MLRSTGRTLALTLRCCQQRECMGADANDDGASPRAPSAWSQRDRQLSLALVEDESAGPGRRPATPDELEYRRRLGCVIAQSREFRGRSQAWLAEKLERSVPAVSRWENGKATMTVWDLAQVQRLLDIPPALLLLPPPCETPISPIAKYLMDAAAEGIRKGLAGLADEPEGEPPGGRRGASRPAPGTPSPQGSR